MVDLPHYCTGIQLPSVRQSALIAPVPATAKSTDRAADETLELEASMWHTASPNAADHPK
jgi:hypothetical protein